MANQQPDLSEIHCEECSYALEGLSHNGVCPECGFEVAMSLPRVRQGTPWQQKAGLRSLLSTWWKLQRDDATWREMWIDRATRRAFVEWARLFAYSFLLLGAIWYTLADSESSLTLFVFVMLIPMLAVEILLTLYRSELSVRLAAGAKLRRECQEQASFQQVLNHAGTGMMIAPICIALGLVCVSIGMHIEHVTGWDWVLRAGFYLGAVFAGFGLVGGCVLFELSYRRGWRAMRYRRLVGRESNQVKDDIIYYSEVDDGAEIKDDWTGFKNLKRALKRNPIGVGGFLMQMVVSPAIYFVLWLAYGFDPVFALLLAIVAFVILSILLRILMVPLRLGLWGKRSR